ncbi:4-alpha-glucanotransferase [Halanaerocella petrolearia]
MDFERSGGVLLHLTSLPGDYGIGSLGSEAYNFIDFLARANQSLWQVCPLGPTGFGDSPYQTMSAFAGNPYLISLEKLVAEGLLVESNLKEKISFNENKVEYGKVIDFKIPLLRQAFREFKRLNTNKEQNDFIEFCSQHQDWLDDYALFKALKYYFDGQPWYQWEEKIKFREEKGITYYQNKLKEEIEFRKYLQYLFFKQWNDLKEYANKKGIKVIGDLPLFVAFDSADVWANPSLFYLDETREPTKVAGVPPDYFSEEGQLWGNPLYNWQQLKKNNYSWWLDRLKLQLELVDILRLDHFSGFIKYWAVPSDKETAKHGHWEVGPGEDFFNKVSQELDSLPFIIEDLGVVPDQVDKIRNKFDFPGMKVLQFAFQSGEDNKYLPHNYNQAAVVYTGTHDNNTTLGWHQEEATQEQKELLAQYTTKHLSITKSREPAWKLLELAWSSEANLTLAPLQDILSLGSQARMNNPGQVDGNWQWRYQKGILTTDLADRLKSLTDKYNR